MKVPSEFKLTSKDAIHKSANSHVFRGTYEGKEAILKVFPFDYPPESVQLAYQKDHNVSSLLYEKYPNDFAQPLNFTNEPNNLYVAKSFEGFSLAQYLKENKKMNVEKFLNTAISVCYKLHLAHEQNVVHCDIKPQNILQSEEKQSTFIIDFESSFLVSLKNPKVPKTDRALKSKEELIEHKREILSVLTDRAKIITNFIPESIYVLGEDLPELLDLPSETTNLFLSCKLEEAIEVFQELVEKSTTNFESLKAIVAYTKLLLFIANFPVAIKLIFDVFEMYEVSKDMPKEKNEDFENWSFKLLHELINFTKGKETGKLFLDGIPKKADEEMSLLSRYMLQSSAVFYQTAQPHFAFANQLMGVKIAVNYGNNDCLPAILASLSWHAQFYFKENEAKIFGKLAQELTKNINSPNIHLYVKFYSGLLQIFNSNATNAIKLTENAYTFGFNIGELNWGSYACFCWMNFNICNGTNFLILLGRVLAAQKAIYNSKHLVIGDMMAASIETIKIITGKSTSFNSVHMIPGYIEIPFGRFNYYEQKATSLFLLQDFKGARIALDTIQQFPTENIGLPHFYEIAMTSILIDYHLYQQSLDNTILENMKANIDLLEGYSKLNAIYFQSRYSLGQALFKSLMIDKTKIEDIVEIFSLFNSASTHAGSNGCSWIEAMAIEYFAEFCEETSQFKEYSRFLYSLAYHKWKAMGVIVRCIKLKQYEAISSTTNPSIDLNTGSASATESLNMLGVDLQTVIKSSNTVSEDLEKKKLLTKLNQVIVENAGATRGFIILKENEKYIVSSEFSSSETQSQISKEILKSSKFLSLRVEFISELEPQNCKKCSFQNDVTQRSSLIDNEYIILTGIEKSKESHSGESSVLFIYKKKRKNIEFQKKLTMPKYEGKFVSGKLHISLSQGKLLVGFVRDIERGDKDKQQALLFEKPDWNITKVFPIHWTDDTRPREGTLKTDVRTMAISGDYVIIGGFYFHNYGIWVNFPIGYSNHQNWGMRFGVMNHLGKSPIASGLNGGNKPSFLLSLASHSYVMFDPARTKNKTETARFQTSLYGTRNGNFGQWSAIDKTGEVVLHSFNGSILVWFKPRNGRNYSYKPDTVIKGLNSNFASSFAAFNEQNIVTVSGDGRLFIYKRVSSDFEKVQEIAMNEVYFESVSQNVDHDGSFVVMGKKEKNDVAFVYQFN
eukprot:gene2106-1973_t